MSEVIRDMARSLAANVHKRRFGILAWVVIGIVIICALSVYITLWLIAPLPVVAVTVITFIGLIIIVASQAISESANGPTGFDRDYLRVLKRAEGGDPEAMLRLAGMYMDGSVPAIAKDPSQSVWWLSRSAEAGNGEAAYRLSLALLSGRGVMRDPASADGWLRRSAERGYGPAIHRLSSSPRPEPAEAGS
jgi:hypothetical protein